MQGPGFNPLVHKISPDANSDLKIQAWGQWGGGGMGNETGIIVCIPEYAGNTSQWHCSSITKYQSSFPNLRSKHFKEASEK